MTKSKFCLFSGLYYYYSYARDLSFGKGVKALLSSRGWVNASKAACQASSTRLACSIVCSLQGFSACTASLLRKWLSERGVLDFLKTASGNSVRLRHQLVSTSHFGDGPTWADHNIVLNSCRLWACFPQPTQILTFSLYSVHSPCCTSTLVGCCSLYPPASPDHRQM